jgi:hypothetical protein
MRFDMCPRGHIARRSNKNWQNLLGRREGLFDNLHDGPVTCVGAWVSQHFGKQLPEKAHRWKVRGRNCLNLVTIGPSIPIDQVVQRNGPPDYGAWGAMGVYK